MTTLVAEPATGRRRPRWPIAIATALAWHALPVIGFGLVVSGLPTADADGRCTGLVFGATVSSRDWAALVGTLLGAPGLVLSLVATGVVGRRLSREQHWSAARLGTISALLGLVRGAVGAVCLVLFFAVTAGIG